MPQFPIPVNTRPGDRVVLSPQDSKHAAKVLRIKRGDEIRLFSEKSRFTGKILSVAPQRVEVEILSEIDLPKLVGNITLCQALLKKEKMEWVIQKATELGAATFIPFLSERTIPTEAKSAKIERWQKISDEALKQCGRISRMEILPLSDFSSLMKRTETQRLLCHEDGKKLSTVPLKQDLLLLIGPEGGFSSREIFETKENGVEIISLGSLTLRAETAAVSALSLIQYELGNL